MPKQDLITIGPLTFVVAPEEVPEEEVPESELASKRAKSKPQPSRAPAPQCTANRSSLSGSKRGPDGYYHMGCIADRMWREKKKGRLERWGIWKTFED